jgi:hypothetical protein
MIDILCYRLLKDQSFLDIFVKNKTRLWKVSTRAKFDDSEYWRVLEMICAYHDKHKTLPTSSGLWNFVCLSKDLGVTEAWNAVLKEALNELQKMEPVRLKQCSDPNVLIEEVITEGRIENQKFIYQSGVNILIQGPSQLDEKGKKKNPTGPDDAKRFVIQELSKDIASASNEYEGVWQENSQVVAIKLDEYLNGKQKRVFSGFGQIDNRFVMRLGKTLVILGNSGDGKSLFTNSMIYNMAAKGERILYNALEFSVDETWEALAFIHQRHLRDRYPLPPKATWMRHDAMENPLITQADINNMGAILTDYANGGVSGPIDVIRKWTLDEFLAYYEANDPQRHYSVVVIDYASHLRLDNNFRNEGERQAAIDNICSRLVSWTHEKNKFLFVTPAQVSKTAAKDAVKRWENSEDEVGESGYTLDSLYYGNALKQDGDLVISVFSPEDLRKKTPPEMLVKCHKHRMTESFGQIVLNVDVDHEYVYDGLFEPLKRTVMQHEDDDDRIDKGLVRG